MISFYYIMNGHHNSLLHQMYPKMMENSKRQLSDTALKAKLTKQRITTRSKALKIVTTR